MKEVIRITSVLTITCIACAFFLATVFSLTKKKIALNEKKEIEEAIEILAPSVKKVEQFHLGHLVLYKLFDEKKSLIGYAFIVKGQGYQGTIKILGVIDPGFEKLGGIEIIDSVETPGLGSKIADQPFRGQFQGLSISPEIECVKRDVQTPNQIKAITGATISSRAVVNILNKELVKLKKRLGRK